MSVAGSAPLRPDRVHEALDRGDDDELRMRSAVIASAALHTAIAVAVIVTPLLMPKPIVRLQDFTPVQLVQLRGEEPGPPEVQPAVVAEPEPEPEPEPVEEEVAPEESPTPEELERQRQQEEEERQRQEEEERQRQQEEERRRQEELERQRRAEEERRRREEEEEARRKRQSASRTQQQEEEPPQDLPQVATRDGQIGVRGGSQSNNLTAEEFAFAWYLEAMLNKIRITWSPPARGAYARERMVVVNFRIDRQGAIIVGPEIFTSSGDSEYDRAALRAILNSTPFPPLPQQYRNSSLGVHLAFTQ